MNTPADTHSYVELRNINKTFGDYRASDDVSFSIEKGKLIGLLGPSGSGKTTILRILAGLETADSGDIYIPSHRFASRFFTRFPLSTFCRTCVIL